MLPALNLNIAYCIENHVDKVEAKEADRHYVNSPIESKTAFISVF